jgi:hypothetical protein
MLIVADAVRILGTDCELTTDQIGALLEQLHVLARFVLDEAESRRPCHDQGAMMFK